MKVEKKKEKFYKFKATNAYKSNNFFFLFVPVSYALFGFFKRHFFAEDAEVKRSAKRPQKNAGWNELERMKKKEREKDR